MTIHELFDEGDDGSRLVEEALYEALVPIEPPPPRREALRRKVLDRAHDDLCDARAPEAGLVTIRGHAEGWLEVIPKVHIKLLNDEAGAQSYLIRLEPGARAPAHDHPAFEECVVLQGEVTYVGGSTLRAGDYQLAKAGARHTELVSEQGAVVFIRYAQPLTNYVQI